MAEKLDMKSMNITEDNVKKIQALFPNVVTEIMDEDGKFKLAIDFDALKQELSNDLISEKQERYQMTWPDKSKAKLLANSRISATLRPDKEKSVNFDTTKNLYIEGDNLDVLKLLRETYLGKIKMIYIDPPYNTGNDFVYEDDFAMSVDEYSDISGEYDEQGNRLVKNLDSNGRFHTDWLNMIYPRLKVARDLLAEDGVIFISIDENEIENLKKIASEVFGEQNFVGAVIWERAFAPKNDAKYFSDSHDYIVVYAKTLESFEIGLLPRTEEANARYKNPDNDPRGPWTPDNMTVKTYSASYDYEIVTPSGTVVKPTDGRCWFTSKERMQKLISDGRVWFGESGSNMPRLKRYLADVQQGMTATTIWKYTDVGHNQEGRQEVKKLFSDKGYFDGPKPLRLLGRILQIANTNKDSIILDFFSGSATTAHAVMQLNAEDDGNRKFIMVQLPEKCEEKSEAYKAGYKTICDIGEERIRRAGKKIIEETGKDIDIGFRVLKLDSSNMNDVYYNPNAFNQSMLDMTVDNVKADRTPLDLLFQVMLDLGVELSADIVEKTVNGKKIYAVNGNDLIACFDNDIDNDVITSIATEKPLYAVFKDKSFSSDSVGINNEQLFKTYSPSTVVKVI